MKKIFANSRHQATFLCDACGKQVVKDVSRFATLDREIRLKWRCSCGEHSNVMLERRQFVRKSVKLPGAYSFAAPDGRTLSGAVTLLDISQRGLRFKHEGSLRRPALQAGQRLSIRFKLDDEFQTTISREVVVRKISGDVVGAEFIVREHYDKLGAYLLFHDN